MSSTYNPATITYEQMMALFLETRERIEETVVSMKETDRKFQETDRKIEAIAKENAKLGNRLGQLVEAMVEGGVIRMFKNLGYDFDVCNKSFQFRNKELDIYGEIDFFLENGEFALLVEVKTNLSVDDVREHQDRLKKFRLWADARNDKRQFLAAVGGGVVRENVREFALKQGMFVVQQSGENVEILVPEGKPKVW
jgi:predicted AAA+ superfamily ATPase